MGATETILERVARGDRKAVEECLDAYGNLVWSLALRSCPSRTEAEDAVQDIFFELWKSADRYDPAKGSEATFIAVLTRRRLIDRRRARLREARRFVPAVDMDFEQTPSEDHVELERMSEAMLVRRALGELPDDRRKVLLLSVDEGMTHEQISQTTGLPMGTVKSHLRRGVQTVRNLLGIRDESHRTGRHS